MSLLPLAAWVLPGLCGIGLWLARRDPETSRRLALGMATVLLALAVWGLRTAAGGAVLVTGFGDWAPPFGIVFVLDRLSALFLLLQSLLLLFAIAWLRPSQHGARRVARALPLLFVLAFGLNGAFLTGDLFNLFVMFEVVLLASYLLLQVPGGGRALRAAFPTVVINLLASLLFFAAVGLLYAATGTVNMADLALRIGDAPESLRLAALTMLVVAFGTKAALVPLLFWLPASYPVLSGPVAAFFAGMMTKLGVYALLRTAPLLMQGTPLPELLVWVGGASALLAVLAALSEYELRRLLGFHITSQVGYMILGLGLMTQAAIAGAIFYLAHHVLVKTALFFIADTLERRNGTRDLRAMRPAAGGGLALAFVLAAFSLSGLPPFSGFFAKLGLFQSTFSAQAWPSLVILVVASFFTLASMLKIWRFAFHGEAASGEGAEGAGASTGEATAHATIATPSARPAPRFELAPLWALTAVSLGLALAAGPAYRYADATAAQLLDVEGYVDTVLSAPGRGGAEGVAP
jgi:multicomponent Na+:H+ antiporter subunit D